LPAQLVSFPLAGAAASGLAAASRFSKVRLVTVAEDFIKQRADSFELPDEILGVGILMKHSTTHLRHFAIGGAAVGANALGALAVSAFALGAFAVGALAIGALAIGKLKVGKTDLRSVSIDDLTIGRLQVRDLVVTGSLAAPGANLIGDPEGHSL
jgi:hypothetical protein